MKLKLLLIPSVCMFILFSCAVQKQQLKNDIHIHSIWTGSFDSNYHSDGIISTWILRNDKTMTGNWKTQNNSTVIDFEGTYSLSGNTVTFQGSGTLLIRSKIKTKMSISGTGKIHQMNANGIFQIQIDHPNFPDDTGTWTLERI